MATLPPKRDKDSDQDPDRRAGWPSWIVPPVAGFEAEDLDHLPDLPRRTELRNGSLVFVSPQDIWHSRVIFHLVQSLRDAAPPEFRVAGEMAVRLARDTQREPDVVVLTREAYERPRATWFRPEDVLLVIEVVSPESRKRDRFDKLFEYAVAGIEHFWRVERDGQAAVVHVYRLNDTGTNPEETVFRDRLVLDEPFPIDIPLDDIP